MQREGILISTTKDPDPLSAFGSHFTQLSLYEILYYNYNDIVSCFQLSKYRTININQSTRQPRAARETLHDLS